MTVSIVSRMASIDSSSISAADRLGRIHDRRLSSKISFSCPFLYPMTVVAMSMSADFRTSATRYGCPASPNLISFGKSSRSIPRCWTYQAIFCTCGRSFRRIAITKVPCNIATSSRYHFHRSSSNLSDARLKRFSTAVL